MHMRESFFEKKREKSFLKKRDRRPGLDNWDLTHNLMDQIVCFISTPKILGFCISVVNASSRNVLKEEWDSVTKLSPHKRGMGQCVIKLSMYVVCNMC